MMDFLVFLRRRRRAHGDVKAAGTFGSDNSHSSG